MSAKTLSLAATALAGAIAMTAIAGAPAPAMAAEKVKCWGISKAGANDCANAAGTHSCAGQSKADFDGGDWKYAASKEACEKDGGQLAAFKGKNPKKS